MGRKEYESPAEQTSSPEVEDLAKYDIVIVDINTTDGLSEKAQMAIAYVLFEDEMKKSGDEADIEPDVKQQLQDEAVKKAQKMVDSIPVAIKREVSKKEALFFKERLAGYGVIALIGYCPDCGGSLNDTSEECTVCGQTAIEFMEDNTVRKKRNVKELFLASAGIFAIAATVIFTIISI